MHHFGSGEVGSFVVSSQGACQRFLWKFYPPCNFVLDSRCSQMYILPWNDDLNEVWLCGKGYFSLVREVEESSKETWADTFSELNNLIVAQYYIWEFTGDLLMSTEQKITNIPLKCVFFCLFLFLFYFYSNLETPSQITPTEWKAWLYISSYSQDCGDSAGSCPASQPSPSLASPPTSMFVRPALSSLSSAQSWIHSSTPWGTKRGRNPCGSCGRAADSSETSCVCRTHGVAFLQTAGRPGHGNRTGIQHAGQYLKRRWCLEPVH